MTRKEKPLAMSAAMMRAVLARQKTVTRRPIKPQPPDREKRARVEDRWVWYTPGMTTGGYYPLEDCRKPRYRPSDIAYVTEAWKTYDSLDHLRPSEVPPGSAVAYLADGEPEFHVGRYRHARFMCRWMSRCRVLIVGAHPERVQDITEEDAQREGITGDDSLVGQIVNPYRTAFADLWDSIYGDRFPFADNPWVWRYEFELMEDA